MSSLPQVTGERLVRALKRVGFFERRQAGSHLIMRHETDASRQVSIPIHGSKPVTPGTLRSILKGAGLSAEELMDLL